MKKRMLALLLAMVLTLGLLPAAALAAGGTVTVKLAAQMDGKYLYPQTELTVEAGTAAKYGFKNASDLAEGTITALDALVAAHVQRYGEAFTSETAGTYLTMSGPNPAMMFQTDATDLFSGFSLNYDYPMDSNKLGYMANNAPLSEGDILDFFYYSENLDDYTAWFTNAAGTKISTLVAGINVPVTVGLAGYEFMTGYAKPSPEALYHETEGALAIYHISEDGAIGERIASVTAAGGAALTFTQLGEQKIVAMGRENKADKPLIMPILTVDVREQAPEEVIPPTGVVVTESQVNLPLDQTHQIQASVTPANAKQDVTYEVLFGEVEVSESGLVTPTDKATEAKRAIIQVKCKEKESLSTTVTVIFKAPPTPAEVLAEVVAQLPATMTPKEWNSDSTDKQDTNLIAMVRTLVAAINPAVSVADTCVPSAEQTQIAADGAITYGEEEITEKTVTLTLTLEGTTAEYSPLVTVAKKAPTKAEALAGEWLTFDIIKGGNSEAGSIKLNLTLPQKDDEGYYTEVEWTSSNTAVLAISSYAVNGSFTGTVTRPAKGNQDASVTLTATIKPGVYWDYGMAPAGPMPNPAYTTKTFELTIPAVSEEEETQAQRMIDEAIKLYSLEGVTARDTKDPANLMALTYHINDIPYNWNYVNKLPGFQEAYRVIAVSWSSTNPGISDVTSGATITRTAADQTGDIVLTLSYNGATAEKPFPTKVLAFTPEEAAAENAALQKVKGALSFSAIQKDNWLAAEVTGNLTQVQAAEVSGDTVSFSTKKVYHHIGANIAWSSSNPAVISNSLVVTRPAATTTVTLTAALTSPRFAGCKGVETVTKEIQVTVLGRESDPMLETIAAKNTGSLSTWWWAVGMSDYAAYYPETQYKVTAEAKQAFVNSIVADVAANSTKSNNLANAINGLAALGYDPTDITTADGTKLNAVDLLTKVDVESEKAGAWSYFTVPGYVLLACNQGDYATDALETATIEFLLANKEEGGGWSTTWGVDATAMTLQGLAPYYATNDEVAAAVDAALTMLSGKQTDTGCVGNASSDAMVILALTALGVNLEEDARFIKGGKTLIDGLMSHYEDGGFGGYALDSQGFLAAVAAAEMLGGKTSYNAFDFAANPKVPAVATPEQGGGEEGGGGDTPSGETMNVSFTLKTHNATWVPKYTLSVKKDATVGDAFKTAMKDRAGFSYVDDSGYISSITNSGTTLAEFTHGTNSGWKYMVNGVACGVGINSKILAAGDDLVWYYVTDYTTDTDRDEGSFTPAKPTNPETSQEGEQTVVEVKPSATTDKNGEAKATLTDKELTAALDSAKKGDAEALVLTPQITGEASAVTVELSALSAAAIAKAGMDVRVDTGLASVRLNAESLGELGAGSGKKVSITARAGENGSLTLEVKAGDDAVKTLAGGLTVALPVEKAAPGAVLVLVGEDGGETVVKLSAAQGNVLTARLNGSATVKVVDNAKTFEDVPQGHWAADATAFVTSRELLKGTGEGAFAPGASMTRASLMTILYRLEGQEEPTVPAGQPWYAPAQSWAVDKGLSDGANPDGEMTRQELATLLYRYAGAKAEAGSLTAPDGQSVAPWAAEAMSWATAEGILTGDHNGLLNPDGAASRAEVSVMLERFVKTLLK